MYTTRPEPPGQSRSIQDSAEAGRLMRLGRLDTTQMSGSCCDSAASPRYGTAKGCDLGNAHVGTLDVFG
jgi:hypothetical protein